MSYRDDSPSYSPPRRSRSRSPSYTAPRERSPSPALHSRRTISPDYGPGVSPPRGAPIRTYAKDNRSPERRRSRSRDRESGVSFPWEDRETLRTLRCRACDVCLNDRDSMEAHLKGRPHLAQLQRLRDKEVRDRTGGRGRSDYFVGPEDVKVKYDENYWDQNRGRNRKLRPEHERFLDSERLENTPAKFDPRAYDNGQFKFDTKENYCSKCDVWTKSRDQMLIHREGANHKKMSAKVQRYRCDMCLIDVPSQDTLDNHMRGKDHIKREKQLQEQRKEKGDIVDGDGYGFKTGPREMAKLSRTEREELEESRRTIKILQNKVKSQAEKLAQCRKEHGNSDLVQLRRKVQWCQENHLRPQEFNRPGIFCKQESSDDQVTSTSRGLKYDPMKYERDFKPERENIADNSREYVERV